MNIRIKFMLPETRVPKLHLELKGCIYLFVFMQLSQKAKIWEYRRGGPKTI